MDAKHIILVDDRSDETRQTMRTLDERGLSDNVIPVHEGFEALDYLRRTAEHVEGRSGDPLVMLLHLHMPPADGLEMLRHIREDPRLLQLPVVVTGARESVKLAEACQLGVEADIDKPVEFEKLVDVVKQIGLLCLLLEPPTPYALAS